MEHQQGSIPPTGVRIGVDVGSSLTKLAFQHPSGAVGYQLLGGSARSDLIRTVEQLNPVVLGLTGGGAASLASQLAHQAVQVNEFTAWGTGANRMLSPTQSHEPYLLVSLGTGTSVMLVDGKDVRRMGGTALGGGTILGLGAALLRQDSFSETCALAAQGSRDSVDLLVRDIYPDPDRPLQGDLTASSFGRLARQDTQPPPQDVAAAIMRLVGENVALIAGGHAQRQGLTRLVFGGSTLRNNPALASVLQEVSSLLGLQAFILEHGEFVGALGALEWAPQEQGEIAVDRSKERKE
jgi:type II pantothenate kinase